MKRIATLLVAIVAACSFRASKHSTMLSASSTEPLAVRAAVKWLLRARSHHDQTIPQRSGES